MSNKPLSSALFADLPPDIIKCILTYLPKSRKEKIKVSPSMQKQLVKLQCISLKGKNNMYMRDLDEFCLD